MAATCLASTSNLRATWVLELDPLVYSPGHMLIGITPFMRALIDFL